MWRERRRLALEAPVGVPDGQDVAVVSWTETAAIWAMVETVSSTLTERAGAGIGTISHRIWLRFRQGVLAGQRFRKGTRRFAVKLVQDPDETGRGLTCLCEESGR